MRSLLIGAAALFCGAALTAWTDVLKAVDPAPSLWLAAPTAVAVQILWLGLLWAALEAPGARFWPGALALAGTFMLWSAIMSPILATALALRRDEEFIPFLIGLGAALLARFGPVLAAGSAPKAPDRRLLLRMAALFCALWGLEAALSLAENAVIRSLVRDEDCALMDCFDAENAVRATLWPFLIRSLKSAAFLASALAAGRILAARRSGMTLAYERA